MFLIVYIKSLLNTCAKKLLVFMTASCLGKTAESWSLVINFLSFALGILRSPVLQEICPEQLFPYASSSNVEVLPLEFCSGKVSEC